MTTSLGTTSRPRFARSLARGLGWLSLGVGVAALLAPRALGAAAGLRGREGFLRACGVRGIVTGVGLLAARRPAPWLWARVAGDALDAVALAGQRPAGRTGRAIAAMAGAAALDAACATAVSRIERRGRAPARAYADRRGLPLPASAMRGVARRDFAMPPDMATPALLAPWPPTARL